MSPWKVLQDPDEVDDRNVAEFENHDSGLSKRMRRQEETHRTNEQKRNEVLRRH